MSALRALGHILIAADAPEQQSVQTLTFDEQAEFDRMGVMIDCSRNAVLLPRQIERVIRTSALLGLNVLQIYTEDTYKIPGEPFFGYYRGGYTAEELRRIHRYAGRFAIEVVPCIQTLGHLGQILQWPRFAPLKDNSEVLLAHYDETYRFIERMIDAATVGGKCRRIHLGMDEAVGLGEGRHRAFFGDMDPQQVFLHHIARVTEICARRQLETMIWSDMLFVLGTSWTPHYVEDVQAPQSVHPKDLPSSASLVYWDYYHTAPEPYIRRIQEHKRLSGRTPVVATGIWTWSRMWAQLPFSAASIRACLAACKAEGVSEVLATIWGDDGGECDILSALPGLHLFAELGYGSGVSQDRLDKGFRVLSGGSLGDWMLASDLDCPNSSADGGSLDGSGAPPCGSSTSSPPPNPHPQNPSNVSKWLLWEDPMVSPMAKQYEGMGSSLPRFYAELAQKLRRVSSPEALQETEDTYPLNRRLRFPAALAQVLSLKAGLAARARSCYSTRDIMGMRLLLDTQVRPLLESVRELWALHRQMWMETYRAFGWEVIEIRYGGLRARLETMIWRIEEWMRAVEDPSRSLEETSALLEELSQEPHLVYGDGSSGNLLSLDYARVASASRALGSG
ncbi:glycoside hydrolase superfamily [Piptocephalis cylindrospora]|uniref:beta-N-acetylhexosaminidase n=1 Tax=Piptocephalis cylindrospora TaxID=1907219 RepID=A0A4V1IYB6_9FUNG|nr:glycoside hydrolase superfamily [Piptocephalis cylindrospora]|eukprot:RKP13989.1 glycoside hydrolase superfamily [Piptocephalis cylindrospora]